ncbi:MAG: tetratricopeptide repeat protein, partial [Planctomycetaceae bacterium]|nr:tetratricopeptide repeat protein [Planctomycetaceae bacterium]
MLRRSVPQSSSAVAALLFVCLLIIYLLNGGLIILADSVSNSYLPVSLLEEGNLSYTPDEFPFMFGWEVKGPGGAQPLAITHLTPTVAALRDEGLLQIQRENYFLVPSARPGLYVNTFGPGAGLTALPAVAVVRLAVGDLLDRRWWLAVACRVVSAACVAGSAALLYLTGCLFVTRGQALALALSYGLGTCVWAISSQSLTQHGPNELYLALGVYALARANVSWRWLAVAGVALSAAVVCRPTSGVVILAVGAYLLVTDWRGCLAFTVACCPLLLFLAGYNYHYFGSPLTFGQTVQARLYLERQFGTTNAWRTPFWTGFFGLLLSPSRGVLIYSPWLVVTVCGAVAVWRRKEYAWLRPLTIAAAAIAVLQCKWFDWWGGWCYGYRPLVDILPLTVPMALPLLPAIWRTASLRAVGGALVAWSIFVQALGAAAFDMEGWNARRGFMVQVPGAEAPQYTASPAEAEALAQLTGARPQPATLNIDFPPHNGRLWSLRDNQIGYYLTHFGESRAARRQAAHDLTWLAGRNPIITHYSLGLALTQLGRGDEALAEYQAAIRERPSFVQGYLNLGNLYAERGDYARAIGAYEQLLQLEPHAFLPRENLARVLASAGRYPEAIEQFQQCLSRDPNSAQTHFHYAETLAAAGDDAAAIAQYRAALRLAANDGNSMRGLAWLLATATDPQMRNPREAWVLARQLNAATRSQDALVLDTAAAAAAALGRYADAVSLAESALKLPALATDPQLAQEIRARLELYRQQQAYVRPRP